MPKFVYAVRNAQGQTVRGSLEAESAETAAARLRTEGYFVTALAAEMPGRVTRAGAPPPEGARANAKLLSVFCQQLATLLQAGVPITNALRVTAMQPGKRGWNETLDGVRHYVESGEALSAALAHYPRTFPHLLVRLVEAGEASGTLDKTFTRLGQHYRSEHELRQKVVGSLTYPAVILFVAVAVVALLLMFVLPNFVDMFSNMGLDLPVPTRVLMGIGGAVKTNGIYLLVGLVALVVGSGAYFRTEAGAQVRDGLLLRVPLLKDLLLQMELARFAHTFGTLLAGGVPALQAMVVVSRVMTNRVLSSLFEGVAGQIRGGASLAGAMEKTRVIPPMMVQMVAVGETTGSLDLVLDNVAELYDHEVENQLKQMTTLIEPAVILMVGLVVATIISSVMLPMFDMISKVQ